MNMKEAFALIAGICINHHTTLEGHHKIQEALKMIREDLFQTEMELPKKDEKTN